MVNISIQVVDPDTNETLGPGQVGEICMKGPLIMKGYVGDHRATANTIDEDGWLHSGDLGYFDEDGFFFITDRMKELIKYKGFQVSPSTQSSLEPTSVTIMNRCHPNKERQPRNLRLNANCQWPVGVADGTGTGAAAARRPAGRGRGGRAGRRGRRGAQGLRRQTSPVDADGAAGGRLCGRHRQRLQEAARRRQIRTVAAQDEHGQTAAPPAQVPGQQTLTTQPLYLLSSLSTLCVDCIISFLLLVRGLSLDFGYDEQLFEYLLHCNIGTRQ